LSKNPLKLRVAYLYPDILQGFCDKANVDAFCQRAFWRNIEVEADEIKINTKIQNAKYDFFYIGGSNIEKMDFCFKHLKNNLQELVVASASNVPMLAVNCGYILFGNEYQLNNSVKKEGLKILDVVSYPSKIPFYSRISGDCKFLKKKTVIGFENHIMQTKLNKGVEPFLTLKQKSHNDEKTEGAMYKNVIGTYITSPLLAQNPHLCDFFIAMSLAVKYKCKVPLVKLCDDIEWYSHDYMPDKKGIFSILRNL